MIQEIGTTQQPSTSTNYDGKMHKNHNKLTTLHLEYVNYPIFLTIYCKESFKNQRVSKCLIEWSMLTQRLLLHEHQKLFHYYHNKNHWCSCKVCIGVATIDWRIHPHLSFQHNKNMTTSHFDSLFFPHFNHLQIAKLMCLWLDIHIGLMFIIILIMDRWVRWN